MTSRSNLFLIAAFLASSASLRAQFHSHAAGVTPDRAVEKWWSGVHDPALDSLIERAVRANLELKIAASRVLEARAIRGATRAGWLPSIDASGTQDRIRGGVPAAGLQSSRWTPFETNLFRQGFDASWEIDFFGGKRHALDAAAADVAAAEEAGRETLVTLLGDVARDYGELREAQRRLAIARELVTLESDALVLMQARAAAGLETGLEVEDQMSRLAVSEAKPPLLESAQQVSLYRLSVLLGEQPGTLAGELGDVKPIPATPPMVAVGLPGELLKRRPDVRRADALIAAASARVGVARSDFFPKITLTGNAGRLGTSFSGVTMGATGFFAVGPALRLPIFTGGRLKANLRTQQERLTQAQLAYRETVLRAIEETEGALTNYGHEQERRDRLRAAAQAGLQATRLSTDLYARGLSDFLAVLSAQRRQLATEDELAQSDTGVFIDLVGLYKALGGGWSVPPEELIGPTAPAR